MGVRRNPALLCAFNAIQMSLFPVAVITIFWQHDLGLSMAEIFSLQAIFAGTTSLLEFPSGVLADRIGYRRSLLIAAGCHALGWTVYLFSPDFWTIAAAEVVLGAGLSLVSGTDSALLYESLAERGEEHGFATWIGRLRFFGQAAEGSAALFAGALYALWPRSVFVLEVAVWIVGLGVAWALVEPSHHRPVVEDAWRHVTGIFGRIWRGAPRLRAVMFLSVVLGLSSFVPVWIIQLYAEKGGVPVAWLGPIWAVANYTVAVGSLASARLGRRLGLMPCLLGCIALAVAGYLGLGLTTAWWGFAFYFLITTMRGINAPLLHHEEQMLLPSGERASFVSARNLLFRATFVVVGPAIGLWLDQRGEHAVLLATAPAVVVVGLAGWGWLLRNPAPAILRSASPPSPV